MEDKYKCKWKLKNQISLSPVQKKPPKKQKEKNLTTISMMV